MLTSQSRCLQDLLFLDTVWLKWIAHFEVGILLLHHYPSVLAYVPCYIGESLHTFETCDRLFKVFLRLYKPQK